MTWKEFQKNINTRVKYIAFVKKYLKMTPITDEDIGIVYAAIDSIDKETYKKEFERIGKNYSKIVVKEAAEKSAKRRTRGGRKKKKIKTKKIQKGGVVIGVIGLYITLGGIALCYIGSCIKECGCCRPFDVLPRKEQKRKEEEENMRAIDDRNRKQYTLDMGRRLISEIQKGTEIRGLRGRIYSPIRVNVVSNDDLESGVEIELSYAWDEEREPTFAEEEAMKEAKIYAENFQEFGLFGAEHLQDMREIHPDMARRKRGKNVLNMGENYRDKYDTGTDFGNVGGHVGGPFSSLFRRRPQIS